MMKKYTVIRDCYAFNRLWLKGEKAEFGDEEKVPSHFKPDGVQARLEKITASLQEKQLDKPQAGQEDKLEAMNIFELRSLAKQYGIEDLPKTATKNEIIAALRGN